jgi:hypothetical protein
MADDWTAGTLDLYTDESETVQDIYWTPGSVKLHLTCNNVILDESASDAIVALKDGEIRDVWFEVK